MDTSKSAYNQLLSRLTPPLRLTIRDADGEEVHFSFFSLQCREVLTSSGHPYRLDLNFREVMLYSKVKPAEDISAVFTYTGTDTGYVRGQICSASSVSSDDVPIMQVANCPPQRYDDLSNSRHSPFRTKEEEDTYGDL